MSVGSILNYVATINPILYLEQTQYFDVERNFNMKLEDVIFS